MFGPTHEADSNSFVLVIVQLQDAPAQTSASWHVVKSLCVALMQP